jgi:hypothetical protein
MEFKCVNDYSFHQKCWIEQYNCINNEHITNTIDKLKSCNIDMSYNNIYHDNLLYYALRNAAHIDIIKYIVNILFLTNIPNSTLNDIQEIIQWNYICCIYNRHSQIDNNMKTLHDHYIWLLDQYAALFGVTYSKSSRLEKII